MKTLTSEWGREPLTVNDEIPTMVLRWRLGREPVSASDEEIIRIIEDAINKQTEAGDAFTPEEREQTIKAGLWLHHENRALYEAVQSGRKEKNMTHFPPSPLPMHRAVEIAAEWAGDEDYVEVVGPDINGDYAARHRASGEGIVVYSDGTSESADWSDGWPPHPGEYRDDVGGGGITPEGTALGHRYVMGNVNAYCPKCSEEQGVTVLDCDYDLDK